MQRQTWFVALGAVLAMLFAVHQRNERLKAEEFASYTAGVLEHVNRVNQKTRNVLDSCRETNDLLTFRGQEKMRSMFSDEAARLQAVGRGWKKAQVDKRLFAGTPAGMDVGP
jgi:hypothetical protein